MLLVKYIAKLLAVNRVEAALNTLEQLTDDQYPNQHDQVIVLSNNFVRLREDVLKGNLSAEEQNRLLNRVSNSILELVKTLPEDLEISVPLPKRKQLGGMIFIKKHHAWLQWTLWALLLLFVFWLQFKVKRGIDVKVKAVANAAAFQIFESGEIQIDESFPAVQLNQFQRIAIPASTLYLQEDFDGDGTLDTLESGLLTITPIPGRISSVYIDQCRFQTLQMEAGTRVTVTLPEEVSESENTIQMDLQPGNYTGILTFQDSLLFECNNASLAGLENEKAVQWMLGRAYIQTEDVMEVRVAGEEENSLILIEVEDPSSTQIEKQDIYIEQMLFFRPAEEGKIKSSIQKAQINFLDNRGRAYLSRTLGRHEYLSLEFFKPLQLVNFNLDRESITVQLVGEIEYVYSGTDSNDPILQNPSTLIWMLHNKLWWLLVPAMLVLLANGLLFHFYRATKPFRY